MATEGKESKFKRLAEARTNRAIKDIRLIGKLSNKNNYSYSEAQVDAIISAVQKELKALRSRFLDTSGADDPVFQLPPLD